MACFSLNAYEDFLRYKMGKQFKMGLGVSNPDSRNSLTAFCDRFSPFASSYFAHIVKKFSLDVTFYLWIFAINQSTICISQSRKMFILRRVILTNLYEVEKVQIFSKFKYFEPKCRSSRNYTLTKNLHTETKN